MSTTPTVQKNSEVKSKNADPEHGWKTILHNCNCHDFDTVIKQLMYAVPCTYMQARRFANTAHTYGKATVFIGTQKQCDTIADKLAEVGLRVTVSQ